MMMYKQMSIYFEEVYCCIFINNIDHSVSSYTLLKKRYLFLSWCLPDTHKNGAFIRRELHSCRTIMSEVCIWKASVWTSPTRSDGTISAFLPPIPTYHQITLLLMPYSCGGFAFSLQNGTLGIHRRNNPLHMKTVWKWWYYACHSTLLLKNNTIAYICIIHLY